ncbi:hypothetical protein C8R45DRAFT_921850 [Mycena sanguinolenta]|nr:hypothetical protein C8R45DRAFT_921850 [Mycena sanguinolenta]
MDEVQASFGLVIRTVAQQKCDDQESEPSHSTSDYRGETLALRLMGEIRVGWSFAKSEKHTTHTTFDAVRNPETKRNCFAKRSKDFSSRKVKVLVSKLYITRAETVNRNRFITHKTDLIQTQQ